MINVDDFKSIELEDYSIFKHHYTTNPPPHSAPHPLSHCTPCSANSHHPAVPLLWAYAAIHSTAAPHTSSNCHLLSPPTSESSPMSPSSNPCAAIVTIGILLFKKYGGFQEIQLFPTRGTMSGIFFLLAHYTYGWATQGRFKSKILRRPLTTLANRLGEFFDTISPNLGDINTHVTAIPEFFVIAKK